MRDAKTLVAILERGPVLPVVTLEDATTALAVADALLAGGITTIEITLRTDAALEAIRAISEAQPDMCVGAGTVRDGNQLDAAAAAGAAFAFSPGATPSLLDAAADAAIPLLPGAGTASEAMALLERGYAAMKIFPAEPIGGVAFLKGLAAPLPEARFCPTGGITVASAPTYLALPSVLCVGGSWLVPGDAVAAGAFDRLTDLASAATALGAKA